MRNEEDLDISLLGEKALVCRLSSEITEETNQRVHFLCGEIKSLEIPGVTSVQPSYTSFCIHFDRSKVSFLGLIHLIDAVYDAFRFTKEPDPEIVSDPLQSSEDNNRKIIEIPVVYGGEEGPDLDWAQSYLGISKEEIIKRHSERLYSVFMIGFTPGFPYLGVLDKSISMPRLPQPRTKVPKGSLGIAGDQTGIYPLETPGGWRIIGRTPIDLFSPWRDPPCLLEPGDRVKFKSIDKSRISDYPSLFHRAENRASKHSPAQRKGIHIAPCIQVLSPGFHSIVVDSGRKGYEAYGVPVSGAADERSYALANRLCGNPPSQPAIEFTLKGPTIRAEKDLFAAVTGSPSVLSLDGRKAPMYQPIFVRKGSILEIGSLTHGLRGYLSVSGGFFVPPVMGSFSTYVSGGFGGFSGRPLKEGDILEQDIVEGVSFGLKRPYSLPRQSFDPIKEFQRFLYMGSSQPIVKVIPGPEFTAHALYVLSADSYTVSPSSNRMGLRLDGPKILDMDANIISSPVVPGTIQVTPDGTPIVLLKDSQTTGGYRRVAVVSDEDLSILGEARPGTKIRFKVAGTFESQWELRNTTRFRNQKSPSPVLRKYPL